MSQDHTTVQESLNCFLYFKNFNVWRTLKKVQKNAAVRTHAGMIMSIAFIHLFPTLPEINVVLYFFHIRSSIHRAHIAEKGPKIPEVHSN